MPLKDRLRVIASKVSLDRRDVELLKRIAEERYDENPTFCYAFGIVCEHLLNPWAGEKAQALLEPLRLFIDSSDNAHEFSVQAANAFTRILKSLNN
jgi:hypothetical protein